MTLSADSSNTDQDKEIDLFTKLKNTDINKMPFDEAMAKLERVVTHLESDKVALEKAITLFEVGDLLRKHCMKRLEQAREKLEKVQEDDGVITGKVDVKDVNTIDDF